MIPKKTLPKLIEYCAIRLFWLVFAAIPFSLRIAISQALSKFVFRFVPSRVDLIRNNIRATFPEKDEAWVEDITRKNILHYGRFFAEFIQETHLSEKFLDQYVVMTPDKETLAEYFKDGAILVLGHLGNWEFHGARMSSWLPGKITVVATRQSNYWTDRLIDRARTRVGMTTIYTGDNDFQGISELRKKNMLGLVADQHAGDSGVEIRFCNRPASTFLGPAVFARVTKAKCYFGYSYHKDGKLYVFVEPLEERPTADIKKEKQKWEIEFTEIWCRKVEEKIREHPEEYFWVHNRWKKILTTHYK